MPVDVCLIFWVKHKPLQHLKCPEVYGSLITGWFGRGSVWTPGQMAPGRLRSLHSVEPSQSECSLLDARHSWEVGPGVHWYTLMKRQDFYAPPRCPLWSRLDFSLHPVHPSEWGWYSDLADHLSNHSNIQDSEHLSCLRLPEPNSMCTNLRVTNSWPNTGPHSKKQTVDVTVDAAFP